MKIQSRFPLRYFSRYGFLVPTVVLVAVSEGIALSQRGLPWRGDLLWTIDWLPVSFLLVAPLTAGGTAFETARLMKHYNYLQPGSLRRSPVFSVLLAYGYALAAVHLVMVLLSLAISQPKYFEPGALLAIFNYLLMVLLFVALGTVIGKFIRPISAGLIAAVLAFAAMYVAAAPSSRYVQLLEIPAPTAPRVGYLYGITHLAAGTVLLCVAIVALLLVRSRSDGGRVSPSSWNGMVVLLAISVMIPISLLAPRMRYLPDHSAPSFCGAVATIPVCYYKQHKRVSDDFSPQLWVIADRTMDSEYSELLPSAFVEGSQTRTPRTDDPSVGPFYVGVDELTGELPSISVLLNGMVQPLHCVQLKGDTPPSEKYGEDLQNLINTWWWVVQPDEAGAAGIARPPLTPREASDLAAEFNKCSYRFFVSSNP